MDALALHYKAAIPTVMFPTFHDSPFALPW